MLTENPYNISSVFIFFCSTLKKHSGKSRRKYFSGAFEEAVRIRPWNGPTVSSKRWAGLLCWNISHSLYALPQIENLSCRPYPGWSVLQDCRSSKPVICCSRWTRLCYGFDFQGEKLGIIIGNTNASLRFRLEYSSTKLCQLENRSPVSKILLLAYFFSHFFSEQLTKTD